MKTKKSSSPRATISSCSGWRKTPNPKERWKSMQNEISTPLVANARCTQQNPIGKADDDPGNEAEERAVEYPLREFYPNAEREQSAVNQHYKRTHWRDDAYYQPAGFP